jgi:hypothetical protein
MVIPAIVLYLLFIIGAILTIVGIILLIVYRQEWMWWIWLIFGLGLLLILLGFVFSFLLGEKPQELTQSGNVRQIDYNIPVRSVIST